MSPQYAEPSIAKRRTALVLLRMVTSIVHPWLKLVPYNCFPGIFKL